MADKSPLYTRAPGEIIIESVESESRKQKKTQQTTVSGFQEDVTIDAFLFRQPVILPGVGEFNTFTFPSKWRSGLSNESKYLNNICSYHFTFSVSS